MMADSKEMKDPVRIIDSIIKQISDIAMQMKALAWKLERQRQEVVAVQIHVAVCGFLARRHVRVAKASLISTPAVQQQFQDGVSVDRLACQDPGGCRSGHCETANCFATANSSWLLWHLHGLVRPQLHPDCFQYSLCARCAMCRDVRRRHPCKQVLVQ
jgi:hypothetical protein